MRNEASGEFARQDQKNITSKESLLKNGTSSQKQSEKKNSSGATLSLFKS
jgi:hypothetical protein